jgi:hypothetical protein
MWKSSKKDNDKVITHPLKMLELTDNKPCISIQIKQIAGQYYFASCTTTHSVWGFICNLKTKQTDKKCDFKVAISDKLLSKNLYVITSNIVNESEIVIIKGNSQTLDTHTYTYLDEDGKSSGTNLVIEPETKAHTNGIDKNGDAKMLGLDHELIQQKPSNNGILAGVDLKNLESKVESLLHKKETNALKTGSLVAVLEQSLHANDIETINWVLSNVDTHVISETVKKVSKEALQQLMQNILIKLQQGVQTSSLLWLSTVLKIRWLEVIKFMNSSSVHSQQSLGTIHTYLSRKTKNLSKYYEVRAKLQMVVETGQAIMEAQTEDDEGKGSAVINVLDMKEIDPTQNSRFPRMSLQVEGDSSEDEQVSDVDEVVEDTGFDQVNEGEDGAFDEGDQIDKDSDDESKQREDLEQYADDPFDDEQEKENLEMDMDDSDEEELE